VTLPEKAALTALEAGLERVRASQIWREEMRLRFSVNWFRWWVTDWNLLADIRSGLISVARSDGILKVTFSLKSYDLLFAVAFGALVLLLSLQRGSMAFAMLWIAMCGISYLFRWLRFRWFVRRCVGDAFEEWAAMAKVA
jgi:hypothetical protein